MMLGGNLSLAALLAARWAESGHFPLSNMYESLLFLAWGITGRGLHSLTSELNLRTFETHRSRLSST
jgi:ABC-type transport system involved in cytochrome c biogenesis permease subunit